MENADPDDAAQTPFGLVKAVYSAARIAFNYELLGSRFQIGDLAVADLIRIPIQQLRNFGVFPQDLDSSSGKTSPAG